MSNIPRRDATRGIDEETPLLGQNGSATGGKSGKWSATHLSSYMGSNVNRNWADVVLILCYVITGLLDSSAVFIWGSFVSMQTGE